MKILFCGGGTLGSVMPLLALWEECKKRGDSAVWIGTKSGIERQFVERAGLPFLWIYGGKLRRYFHWRNFFDPLLIFAGIVQSCIHIIREKPDVIVNAGSFIGVPVIAAGALLGKKCILFQLDIEPSVSNLIVAPYANHIFASCPEAARSFSSKKIRVVGIPVSTKRGTAGAARASYGIPDGVPVVLVMGGGTGALSLNELVWDALPALAALVPAHIVHLTGIGKEPPVGVTVPLYHARPTVAHDDLLDLLLDADCVVSRAGMGTIAELSTFAKTTILIPIPQSHQEKNARWAASHAAARTYDQRSLTPESFARAVARALAPNEQTSLSRAMKKLLPPHAAHAAAELLHGL